MAKRRVRVQGPLHNQGWEAQTPLFLLGFLQPLAAERVHELVTLVKCTALAQKPSCN